MNLASVTGKNWILKKFNEEDISYLKDNYFLDDITSRLLAIRKIKKDEISKEDAVFISNCSFPLTSQSYAC